jgi:hypothetical protein
MPHDEEWLSVATRVVAAEFDDDRTTGSVEPMFAALKDAHDLFEAA